MSEPFLAEIIMFGGNFAPRGWALCDGQLLPIAQYSAVFSLLGTNYGGDGRTTFGLPDLRGRIAMHPGTGPGLPTYRLGERGGNCQHQLTQPQMPAHTHTLDVKLRASTDGAGSTDPTGNALAEVFVMGGIAGKMAAMRAKEKASPEIQDDEYSLLCEQTYHDLEVKRASTTGKDDLILLLRNQHFFPIGAYMDKIADVVMDMYASKGEQLEDLVFDDKAILAGNLAAQEELAEIEDEEEEAESETVDDLIEDGTSKKE